jgi:MOB kinase activator 1
MSWVQRLLEDESVFPTKSGTPHLLIPNGPADPPFPKGRDFQPSFPSTAKHIYKQLFRIFAHIYHAHFTEILHLSLEAHFNSLFAHYIAFGREYDLLDAQDTRELRMRGGGVMWLTDRWAEMGILEGSEK